MPEDQIHQLIHILNNSAFLYIPTPSFPPFRLLVFVLNRLHNGINHVVSFSLSNASLPGQH
jgi:hypothetical protein